MMLHPVTLQLLGHAHREDLEREALVRRLRSDLGPEVGGPIDARSGLGLACAAPTGDRGHDRQLWRGLRHGRVRRLLSRLLPALVRRRRAAAACRPRATTSAGLR